MISVGLYFIPFSASTRSESLEYKYSKLVRVLYSTTPLLPAIHKHRLLLGSYNISGIEKPFFEKKKKYAVKLQQNCWEVPHKSPLAFGGYSLYL